MMFNIADYLGGAYETCGVEFVFNTNSILLMKDESFPLDETGNVVFRGRASELSTLKNGDIMTCTIFNNGLPMTVINTQPYGNQEEERLLMFREM